MTIFNNLIKEINKIEIKTIELINLAYSIGMINNIDDLLNQDGIELRLKVYKSNNVELSRMLKERWKTLTEEPFPIEYFLTNNETLALRDIILNEIEYYENDHKFHDKKIQFLNNILNKINTTPFILIRREREDNNMEITAKMVKELREKLVLI